MSESELQQLLKEVDHLVDHAKCADELQAIEGLIGKTPTPPTTSHQPVRWRKRDGDGNIIYGRPRSSRNLTQTVCHRHTERTSVPFRAPDTSSEVISHIPSEVVESFLQELTESLDDPVEVQERPGTSTDWSLRKSLSAERWEKERPQLVNAMVGRQNVETRPCQQCRRTPAAVRCRDCLPHPFLCGDCDVEKHSTLVLHNRDAMIAGFFQPLPPTTCVVEMSVSHCVRLVPLEMPEKICNCSSGSLGIKTGKSVSVISMNGRYDLSMPEIQCEVCQAAWTAGVEDLINSDYWPGTLNLSTLYATDVFFSFEELKMASPGLSFQAFLRMLDQRTIRFGRTGKICADSFRKSFFEWEAARFKVDSICREEHFVCPACTPNMLAVSVDGNRKHYRFKNAARSEEKALFEGIFIANDEEVETFVEYIHSSTKHVSGRGVCGGEWAAARETSQKSKGRVDEEGLELAVCRHGVLLRAINMFRGEIFAYPLFLQSKLGTDTQTTFFAMDVTCKYWPYLQKVVKSCPELGNLLAMKPFLSVFHAKAHDFKCEVKWSGAYQDGAGLTLGEEVEQCNAFLSRIAVTTKHMSKAGRTDMLTLMAMRWNQQKFNNLATTLSRRYQKATKVLECQLQILESMKVEMTVTEKDLEGWANDVKEWAEAKTTPDDGDVSALASRIEVLVATIKRRSQRLYKDTDGNKGRARMRRKIREEKTTLSSVVEKYNAVVPGTEALCVDTILSTETVWPWQLPHGGSVDLRCKRRAFDVIMAIRRLQEEKKILVTEMDQHWKSLLRLENTLKGELCGLCEEGVRRGLRSLIMKKQEDNKTTMKLVRNCYLQVLSGRDVQPLPFERSSDSDSDSDY